MAGFLAVAGVVGWGAMNTHHSGPPPDLGLSCPTDVRGDGTITFLTLEGGGFEFVSGQGAYHVLNLGEFYGGNLSGFLMLHPEVRYPAHVEGSADACSSGWFPGQPLLATVVTAQVPDLRIPFLDLVPSKPVFSVNDSIEIAVTLRNPSSLTYAFDPVPAFENRTWAIFKDGESIWLESVASDLEVSSAVVLAPAGAIPLGTLRWNQTTRDGQPACSQTVLVEVWASLWLMLPATLTVQVARDPAFVAMCKPAVDWSEPRELLAGGPAEYQPALVEANGTLVLAWSSGAWGSGEYAVFASRSLDGGGNWSAPRRITEGGSDGAPSLARAADGTIVLAFARATRDTGSGTVTFHSEVLIMRSTDGGSNWGPPAPLSASGSEEGIPVVHLRPNGDLWLLSGAGPQTFGFVTLLLRTSHTSGADWSAPTPVARGSFLEAAAVGEGQDGRAELYYGDNGALNVTSSEDGFNWSTPLALATGEPRRVPAATGTMPGNETWLVVGSYSSGNSDLWLWVRASGASNWSRPTQIMRTPGMEGSAVLRAGQGGAVWLLYGYEHPQGQARLQLRCTPAAACPTPHFASA